MYYILVEVLQVSIDSGLALWLVMQIIGEFDEAGVLRVTYVQSASGVESNSRVDVIVCFVLSVVL